MNIIYFGTDVFLSVFRWLIASEHKIVALYTYHNSEDYICEHKIVALAAENGIPVYYNRITAAELGKFFANGQCNLVLSAEYDAKIPLLPMPNFRGLNIHNSLLPEGRGYGPIEARLLKGYEYGGVTIHKLSQRFDEGDIISQEKFSILPRDNAWSLYEKCDRLAAAMLQKVLCQFNAYWQNAQPQEKGSYWLKYSKADYTITSAMTIAEIEQIYRAFAGSVLISLDGEEYRVAHIETPRSRQWKFAEDKLGKSFWFPAEDGEIKVYLQKDTANMLY